MGCQSPLVNLIRLCDLDYSQAYPAVIHSMPPKAKAKQAKVAAKKEADRPKSTAKTVKNTPKAIPKPIKHARNVTPAKYASKPKPVPTPVKSASKPKPVPTPPKRAAPVAQPKGKATAGIKKTKSAEEIVKVITKGGAAVDSFVVDKEAYRVFQDGGKIYSATLNQADLNANNNKFYIIQILQHEASSELYFWSRWGRVGVPGQNCKAGPLSKSSAIQQYTKKYYDKASKGSYRQIEIKYDDQEPQKEEPKKSGKPKKEVKSKMDDTLQNLINLIFDVNIMNNTMKEIGYDAKKMPLGRLGESTIKDAYAVLTKLTVAVNKKDKAAITNLSGDFYSLIPHNFGFQKMANFVLDNDEKLKQKLSMLSTISDLKITSKLLEQKGNDEESVLDQNYKKLGCSIKPVEKKTGEYKLLSEYFDNTKSNYGKVTINDIFEVERKEEHASYNQKLGNNVLLWHGSRVSNFVGILSQGMRIAPPEAPASGYLFGKGIYLADMAEKSINYCRAHGQDHALILLIEGAIGDPNILSGCNSSAKELMLKNKKDSTWFKGSKAPPASSYKNHKSMIVPHGKPASSAGGGWGSHSEYIVYNINQARIRYILRMNMHGQ